MSTDPTKDLAAFFADLRYKSAARRCARARDRHRPRHGGERDRRPARRRDRPDRGAGVGARRSATVDGDGGAAQFARRRDPGQRLSGDGRDGLRHPSADAVPRDARGACRRPWRSPSSATLSGRDLLVAIAAGLETVVRVGAGMRYPSMRARGWHSPGVIGPFGGAAARRSLLGLDAGAVPERAGARRHPVGRHLRALGHADDQVPPVARGAVRAAGRAARRAGLPGRAGDPDRRPRRTVQSLLRRRRSRQPRWPGSAKTGCWRRSRCACGRPRARSSR